MSLTDELHETLQHAWNAFDKSTSVSERFSDVVPFPQQRAHSRGIIPKSRFTSSVFNRIAIDVANTTFSYVVVDDKTKDEVPRPDIGLHNILNVEANMDQSAFSFIHDLVYSMFDEGVVAICPVKATLNPEITQGYDITDARVGQIVNWYTDKVRVSVYNDKKGQNEEVLISKRNVAIIENPLYAVVNGQNSTLTRLMHKMSMVDNMDEIMASGRLDILIQLPYALKTEARKESAKERISNIAHDLSLGKNGIAYIDATEKVTQLNRPANTQVVENAKMLQEEFYNQLGLTANVMNGTASESEMRLYYARSIDPIVKAILQELNRKFISTKARTLGHTLVAHRDNFIMTPVEQIATLSDTLKRNAVLTSNEVRKLMGFRPHSDPEADRLSNPNMPESDKAQGNQLGSVASPEKDPAKEPIQNGDNS